MSQASVESQESKWSEWEGGEKEETSGSWARRRELLSLASEDLDGPVGEGGLVGGGREPPKSVSALKQARREELSGEWDATWRISSKGRGLFLLDSRPPSTALTKHIHSLPRRHATLLSRLRLDHSDLGASKRVLNKDDDRRFCACGALETRDHFLLECRRYETERAELIRAVRRSGGGPLPLSLPTLFSPRFTFPLLRFLHSTGRFSSLFSLVIPPSSREAP
jgi:hypothetical protein